jgi:hypothetical protein
MGSTRPQRRRTDASFSPTSIPIGLVDILDDAQPDYLERAGMKTVKRAELVAIGAIGWLASI